MPPVKVDGVCRLRDSPPHDGQRCYAREGKSYPHPEHERCIACEIWVVVALRFSGIQNYLDQDGNNRAYRWSSAVFGGAAGIVTRTPCAARAAPRAGRRQRGCATLWWLRGAVTRPRHPGDWLSGRAPRSHRGGHWFDPSIAHRAGLGWSVAVGHLPAGRSICPGPSPRCPHNLWLRLVDQFSLGDRYEPGQCPPRFNVSATANGANPIETSGAPDPAGSATAVSNQGSSLGRSGALPG